MNPAPLLTKQIDQMVLVVATVFLPLLFVSGKSGAG
jgi:hypothetical protein